MKIVFIIGIFITLTLSRNYPLYKQCDGAWGSNQLGTSSSTICQKGCAISSVAMALSGIGQNYNPGTINTWLKSHGGYTGGDGLIWGSVGPLGLSFVGKLGNGQIKSRLDSGSVVICNVHNGGHWVLATGYSGDNIMVNDPGYSTSSYSLSQIVQGNNAVYTVGNANFLWSLIQSIDTLIHQDSTAIMEIVEKSQLQREGEQTISE